jgi:hypothetical protein
MGVAFGVHIRYVMQTEMVEGVVTKRWSADGKVLLFFTEMAAIPRNSPGFPKPASSLVG